MHFKHITKNQRKLDSKGPWAITEGIFYPEEGPLNSQFAQLSNFPSLPWISVRCEGEKAG